MHMALDLIRPMTLIDHRCANVNLPQARTYYYYCDSLECEQNAGLGFPSVGTGAREALRNRRGETEAW